MSKVMVSLPDDLLSAIDAETARRSISRSAFLASAAMRELARRESAAMAAAVARSETRFTSADAFDAADLIRAARDGRR